MIQVLVASCQHFWEQSFISFHVERAQDVRLLSVWGGVVVFRKEPSLIWLFSALLCIIFCGHADVAQLVEQRFRKP